MSARASRRRVAALAFAAALSTGCDLVYPWSGATAPATPGNVRTSLTTFDSVAVSWTRPDGIGAYEISGRIAAGAWASLGRVSGKTSRVEVALDPSVPEAVDLGFRVRAVVGDTRSEWSPEAAVARGLRPPSAFTASTFGFSGPVQLAWQRGSTIATELVLERRAARGGVELAPWSPLAGVGVGDVSYVDSDVASWTDGAWLEYRLRYALGTLESASAAASTGAAPPAPAVGLTATCDGGLVVHLAWTPVTQIAFATQVVLRQRDGDVFFEEIANLGRAAATYEDAVPVGAGYSYRIATRVSGSQDVWSAPATVVTGIGPFLPAYVDLPGLPVERDTEGRFTLLSDDMYGYALRVYLPDAAGWVQHDVVSAGTWLTPRYLRAENGAVSVLYSVASNPSRDWKDGTGWHTEALPFTPSDAAVDASGALHLVRCNSYVDLGYATNRSGAWVSEQVAHAGRAAEYCTIAIGADGEPRIAYAVPRPVDPAFDYLGDTGLAVHGASGWRDGPGPVSGFPFGPTPFRLLAVAGGMTLVMAPWNDPALSVYDLGPGGWGPAVQISSYNASSFVVSPDGTRVALAARYPTVAVREAAGAWATWSLAGYGSKGVGFDPAGKLWVVAGWTGSTSVVYTER